MGVIKDAASAPEIIEPERQHYVPRHRRDIEPVTTRSTYRGRHGAFRWEGWL